MASNFRFTSRLSVFVLLVIANSMSLPAASGDWYAKTPTASNYFDIGPGSANAGREYISHGAGAGGGNVQSFTIYYVTNAIGTVNANVSFYQGRNSGGLNSLRVTPQLNDASWNLTLPATQNGVPTGFSYTANFGFLTGFDNNFEYGLKHLSGGTVFGPWLNSGSGSGTFNSADTHLGGIGQAYNVFELWSPRQSSSGALIQTSWYGPTGSWASGALRLSTSVVPEPTSAILLSGLSIVLLGARRRGQI